MSKKLDQSKLLDNLDINKDIQSEDKEESKNNFFRKNRGGIGGGDYRDRRSGGDSRGGRGGEDFRDGRSGRDFRGGRGGGGDFRDRRSGEDFRGGGRDFRGGGRDFNGGRDFRGGGRDFRGGGRDFRGGFPNQNNNDRGRGGFGGFNRGGRGGSGFNRPDYYDDKYRNYNEMENNFDRNTKNEENNEEYQMEKEAQFEKEKYLKDFKEKYKKIIEGFKILFVNEQPTDEEIYQIILNINNKNLTIFEAMNLIYREIQIIKTLQFINSGQKREYGPNQDIFEQQKYQYFPKNNLNEVIQNYKIYKDKENYNEKNWLFFDDFDRRRKLIKDELGYFNYLPILNLKESNNNENDIYAKNENELLYHYLYYKTLMCKNCPLSDENELKNDLCPYAHDILKDFRIIYDYKSEEVCSFMNTLLSSKLFDFVNYINYIPMSLSPEFNLDTFKVHKCQLDKNCPNDYHLCPYYHNSVDGDCQRRPPLLFGYSGNTGDICFDERKKKYCPKKCPCGIFCQYLHNKNEYNYHPEHFRKEYQCKRPKIKGKCIYSKTCYGIHSNESNETSEEEQEEEEDENIKQEEIEEDEKIIENKNKVDISFTVAKNFRCRKCQNVSENGEFCYFVQCKHFICVKCFKKISAENKKKSKKEKKELLLVCPFCENELKKGEVIKGSFK